MTKDEARQILDDALLVWKELRIFNGKYEGVASLYFGDEIQLVDETHSGFIGSLAEDIADTLHLTRKYYPTEGGGLCTIEYKGFKFFSSWRNNG